MHTFDYNHALKAVEYIQSVTSLVPGTGIILGTGLGSLAHRVDEVAVIDYSQIPGFPLSQVESHHGKLIFGYLSGKPVVVMQGRFHYYEGHSMQAVVFPVRVMKLLGISRLLISNAAGGLSPEFDEGDLMLITDHINLLPENPLRGPNDQRWGSRWPDMYAPYDSALAELLKNVAKKNDLPLREGVYAAVCGPNLETPAEYKYLRTIGADAVGMSTVPEVIAAVHMGLPVAAVSIITDLCTPGHLKPVNIADIIRIAGTAEPKLTELFAQAVALPE